MAHEKLVAELRHRNAGRLMNRDDDPEMRAANILEADYSTDETECDACEVLHDVCAYHHGLAVGASMMAKAIAFFADDPELAINTVARIEQERAASEVRNARALAQANWPWRIWGRASTEGKIHAWSHCAIPSDRHEYQNECGSKCLRRDQIVEIERTGIVVPITGNESYCQSAACIAAWHNAERS